MPFQIGGVFSSCSCSTEKNEWNSSKFLLVFLSTCLPLTTFPHWYMKFHKFSKNKKNENRIRRLTEVEDFPNQVFFRRLYPVDMKRVNEFGVSYDDQEKEQDKPQKLESPYKTPSNTLAVKGLITNIRQKITKPKTAPPSPPPK